ncbi:hypothetical protein BV898_05114 [Hypsibius exemplaris]|uniref:Uncharacterized protein n=1 Tax=Hypsibius exemplaris TaxID=2072580 RepID=A0A1W0X0S4_HYPEX|nr:hypothetical protein BV898_05114 [Hypsibius exemplaris]
MPHNDRIVMLTNAAEACLERRPHRHRPQRPAEKALEPHQPTKPPTVEATTGKRRPVYVPQSIFQVLCGMLFTLLKECYRFLASQGRALTVPLVVLLMAALSIHFLVHHYQTYLQKESRLRPDTSRFAHLVNRFGLSACSILLAYLTVRQVLQMQGANRARKEQLRPIQKK